jgi:hypothetical protein
MPGIVDAQAYRLEDPSAVFANCLRQGDEGLETTARGSRAKAVKEEGDLAFVEVACKYGAQRLLKGISAPYLFTG